MRLLHQKMSLYRKFACLALLIQTMLQFFRMKDPWALVLSQFGEAIWPDLREATTREGTLCLLFSHEI